MGNAWRLTTILGGAAAGAERGGLDAAIALGLEYGGWRSLGDDPPEICASRMRTTSSGNRGIARRLNVQDSDGTLILSLARDLVGGAAFVARAAESQRKNYLHIVLPAGDRSQMPEAVAGGVREWIRDGLISVLNVAGPTEDEAPGIQATTRDALVWIFEDEVDVAARAAPGLIPCPCGCGLLTTGTMRCDGCSREISLAHWDELHGSCGECVDALPDSEAP